MSFVSFSRQMVQKNSFQLKLNEFVTSNSGMPVILDFLDNPFSASINPATSNTWGEDRYNSAIGFLNEFDAQENLILESNPATAGGYIRILATLPDGTVWYDSQRNISSTSDNSNTYNNFLKKSITENHNNRSAFLQALLSDDGYGYEGRVASITGFNGARDTRIALRLGPNKNNVIGIIAMSLDSATFVNP
jgi:hypothetical protein